MKSTLIMLLLSLLFLFGGLVALGSFNDSSGSNQQLITYSGKIYSRVANRMTMQQIDSLSSALNYNFTEDNKIGYRKPVTSQD